MHQRRILSTLLIFTAALSLVMACTSSPKCTIKGTVSSQLDSVWLVDKNGNTLDSCAVRNGAFSFKCDLNGTSPVSVFPGRESDPVPIIPDARVIRIAIGDGPATVTGSPLSEELNELQQWLIKQFDDADEKAMALYGEDKDDEADAVMMEMSRTVVEHCKEVYLKHLQDPIGIQAMALLMGAIPDEEFFDLYEQGGDIIRNDANIGGYYESLTTSDYSVIELEPDGSYTETDGLPEVFIGHGKYTLVDFWASWCGPCKEETPFVVKAYNDYKDKGLVVLGIPVQDKREATIKAMVDLGIYYPQLLDPKAKLAQQFDVTGIPHLFLFGPDGQIVKEGMRGKDTDALLKTIFK